MPPGASGLPLPATSSGGSSKRFLWTFSFYAQFFDVDTSSVLSRCWAALFPRANFLDVLEGNPDLYGPFWIATTVVFILFLGGTISQYLAASEGEPFVYDFRLLSGMLFLVKHVISSRAERDWKMWMPCGKSMANINHRRGGSHLWLYALNPHLAFPRSEILRQRVRELA